MKKTLVILFILALSHTIFSQSCMPSDPYFNNQSEIDAFLINYPNCTSIQGNITIDGEDITNLNGFQNITTFENGILIYGCPQLENLNGLESLTYVGDYFDIQQAQLIDDLDELSNLTYVGGALDILYCPLLTDLNGLGNIESSPTHIIIWGNPLISSLDGLSNIQSVSTTLKLQNNSSLSDISALSNISFSELSYLTIKDNIELSVCNINSICNALENGITEFTIENNGNDCNTVSEIEEVCATSIEEVNSQEIGFYPNPAKTELIFHQTQKKSIRIFNSFGQEILFTNDVTTKMNVSGLSPGFYLIQAEYSDRILKNKLIIK